MDRDREREKLVGLKWQFAAWCGEGQQGTGGQVRGSGKGGESAGEGRRGRGRERGTRGPDRRRGWGRRLGCGGSRQERGAGRRGRGRERETSGPSRTTPATHDRGSVGTSRTEQDTSFFEQIRASFRELKGVLEKSGERGGSRPAHHGEREAKFVKKAFSFLDEGRGPAENDLQNEEWCRDVISGCNYLEELVNFWNYRTIPEVLRPVSFDFPESKRKEQIESSADPAEFQAGRRGGVGRGPAFWPPASSGRVPSVEEFTMLQVLRSGKPSPVSNPNYIAEVRRKFYRKLERNLKTVRKKIEKNKKQNQAQEIIE